MLQHGYMEEINVKKIDFFNGIYNPASEKTVISKLAYQFDSQETAHVIKTADDVLKHSFLFDMEWDMERTYEPVCFGEKIDWEYKPDDDPEFTWQFNRHRFLICLGQAYLITGKEEYAKGFIDLILQFIHNEKISKQNRYTTWRILEIGIRGGNWIKALYLIKDSAYLNEEVLNEIYESMQIHGDTIVNEHYPYCYAGNWGVLENHGLFLLGMLLPQNNKTREYASQAIEVLNTAIKMQVLPDGMQLEQSPMYHNEVLRCMLEVILFAGKCGYCLQEEFKKNVHRMALASLKLLKPNGHQFTMGDSDDMNMKPIMALAGYIFEDERLKFMGGKEMSFDNLWILGSEGVNKYLQIPSKEPEFTSDSLYDSGHYIMRSSWNEDADILHFDGGMLGTSHGHSDTLHIDLILNGVDVLIDPGRYTYVNKKERFDFKNSPAHNTIVVDDKNFNEWDGSWFSKTVSAQLRQKMVFIDKYEYAQAGHSGYMDLDNPVWITRKILHIKPDIYVIADECYASGKHKYTQYFHFDEEGDVSLKDHVATYQNGDTKAGFYFDCKGNEKLIKTEQSKHYNQKINNYSICCVSEAKGFQSLYTVCVKGNREDTKVEKVPVKSYMKNSVLPENIAEGLSITHNGEKYLVVVAHTEMLAPVDLYQIEDCVGCGNVIVFEPKRDKVVGNVLNW